jgi:hypothetical protein
VFFCELLGFFLLETQILVLKDSQYLKKLRRK